MVEKAAEKVGVCCVCLRGYCVGAAGVVSDVCPVYDGQRRQYDVNMTRRCLDTYN